MGAALECLVQHGLEVNQSLTYGSCLLPLHVAARHNRPDVVNSLIALRANLHATNARGLTALEVARSARSNASVAALQRAASSTLNVNVAQATLAEDIKWEMQKQTLRKA